VLVVSRRRPAVLADGVGWRAADATDPDAASDVAKGAAVIYQCLNAPTPRGRSASPHSSAACCALPNATARCW